MISFNNLLLHVTASSDGTALMMKKSLTYKEQIVSHMNDPCPVKNWPNDVTSKTKAD